MTMLKQWEIMVENYEMAKMRDKEKAAFLAASKMADIAGGIVGVDLNGFRKRPAKGATVDELWFELPRLKSAVMEYNAAIIALQKDNPK